MKVVILAGGIGSRLGEETTARPKPMVEIGHRPILWHIMKHYGAYGFNEFVIALGYRGAEIKQYMSDYASLAGDQTLDMKSGKVVVHDRHSDEWRVTLAETGSDTETAGRLQRVAKYIDGTFMMTYGDGVADIDLFELLAFHRRHGALATVTAVRPTARFGHLDIIGDQVTEFIEKPQMETGWINGGFFVLEPEALDYIPGDCDWAREPLEHLARDGQLMAYRHEGFWHCMDTLRDRAYLQERWDSGDAPWRVPE